MRKIIKKIEGIAFTTNEFEVRGKKWQFSEEELKIMAPKMIGKPFTIGHRGPRVGIIDEAWYENGEVRFRASIYEPRNDVEKDFIKKYDRGEIFGVSPGFTFPLQKQAPERVVLHGKTEVIGKSDDGKGLLVRFEIPKEEIEEKMGSIKNLKNINFNRFWLHDGSEEAKRKVEDRNKKRE